jgi:hypothetical protein
VYAVEFSPAAMAFVAAWFKGQGVFSLNLFDSQWAENFAFITAAGFFTRGDEVGVVVKWDYKPL